MTLRFESFPADNDEYLDCLLAFFETILEFKQSIQLTFFKFNVCLPMVLKNKRALYLSPGLNCAPRPWKWPTRKCHEFAKILIQVVQETSIKCLSVAAIKFDKQDLEFFRFWFQEPFGDVIILPFNDQRDNYLCKNLFKIDLVVFNRWDP